MGATVETNAKMPSYYAGVLDVGVNPDWERVARSIDLVRSNGIGIVCAPAVLDDRTGQAKLPFFTRSPAPLLPFDSACANDPRASIECLVPYQLARYAKIDPRKAGNLALRAMVKLGSENAFEAPTKPSELKPPVRCDNRSGDAFAGLVGLSRQRDMLKKIATLVAKHGRASIECLHMAFVGAPGTGKTELARRLLRYLDASGVTDGNATFVKVAATDLVGQYMGHTPARTRATVERAYGGMLFVDEVYGLLASSHYGQEAIDTLVDMLEEDRDRLVCVVAGYADEMEELFRLNPGLRDRFGFRVLFEDYTTAELHAIFELFARTHGFEVHGEAQATLDACLERLRGGRDFANARSVRRLFDRAAIETAYRSDRAVIEACDIRAAFEQPDMGAGPQASRCGFGR